MISNLQILKERMHSGLSSLWTQFFKQVLISYCKKHKYFTVGSFFSLKPVVSIFLKLVVYSENWSFQWNSKSVLSLLVKVCKLSFINSRFSKFNVWTKPEFFIIWGYRVFCRQYLYCFRISCKDCYTVLTSIMSSGFCL